MWHSHEVGGKGVAPIATPTDHRRVGPRHLILVLYKNHIRAIGKKRLEQDIRSRCLFDARSQQSRRSCRTALASTHSLSLPKTNTRSSRLASSRVSSSRCSISTRRRTSNMCVLAISQRNSSSKSRRTNEFHRKCDLLKLAVLHRPRPFRMEVRGEDGLRAKCVIKKGWWRWDVIRGDRC